MCDQESGSGRVEALQKGRLEEGLSSEQFSFWRFFSKGKLERLAVPGGQEF